MRAVKKIKRKVKKIIRNFDNPKIEIKSTDKNKVWAFCSGNYSNDFRGNPKYLFLYINENRPDIDAYWLCSNDIIIKEIKDMGYEAYKIGTLEAELAIEKTGVLVSEQVKMSIPKGLENAKYLNLWHGVGGVKNVERSITDGILLEEISKKYILRNEFYRKNQLYLATSKKIEDIACNQLGLDEGQIIRAGYPRCIYLINNKSKKISLTNNLPCDTKIICYAPTYRNEGNEEFFKNAIPKIDKLIELCKKKHYLFIFKMHPFLEKEPSYLRMKEEYSNSEWLKFWDNNEDFYEILNQIDLCIYDYSSIFTDFISVGTKYYIRYLFDIDEKDLKFTDEYDDVTVGTKCKSFDELINCLNNYEKYNYENKINEIKKMYWEYDRENSMDYIIDYTLKYDIKDIKIPNLYSFDIFDTIISRKCIDPIGIFYYVKYKMEHSDVNFPDYLIKNFPDIRKNAELNIREYYNRTINERNDERCEIKFDEIYERIQELYNLSDEQSELLKKWEIEAELENVYPLTDQIKKIKELINNGEKVILISDMYLPKDVIKSMLKKADPILENIDLYLSSEYGYEKSKKTLYLEVYKKFGVNYNFKNWIHIGDNLVSDIKKANELNIQTKKIDKIEFNEYEKKLVNSLKSYDSFLLAANIARFRVENSNIKDVFVYSYISLLFVPYVLWAMKDALANNIDTLYFVSRDGHQLKRIAEVLNAEKRMNLGIKYIYASRKTWRIPSFIDKIDVDFWGMGHGNFVDIEKYDKLLKAMNLNEEEFREIFPELDYINNDTKFSLKLLKNLAVIFKNSSTYNEILLRKAKEQRKSVCGYLEQEIDSKSTFAIVEYWGRGYTQENFTRLWHEVSKDKEPVTFYYSRSTLPSEEYNIRKNFTSNPSAFQFIESIFACINYKSIEEYKLVGKKWEPVIKENTCDNYLFNSMEKLLPEFAKSYCNIGFIDEESLGRELIDFAINYYNTNTNWIGFTEVLAKLKDSVQLYGEVEEFAPIINKKHLDGLKNNSLKIGNITKNIKLSLYRTTNNKIKEDFYNMYQINNEGEKLSGKLSKNQMKSNKKYGFKLKLLKKKATKISNLYNDYNDLKVENKITILIYGLKNKDLEFEPLINELKKQKTFNFEVVNLLKKSNKYIAKTLATSKYIIIKKPMPVLNEIDFKNKTKIILLPENIISYFKKGINKTAKLQLNNELNNYKYKIKPNIIQISNCQLFDNYKSVYNLDECDVILESGSSISDIYFDKNIKEKLLKKLYTKFPQARNKKIILYAPYQRYKNRDAHYYDMLDMKEMAQKLSDQYVVIINFPKNNYSNKIEIKGFSKDLTDDFSLRQMLLMSDIVVGDYRNTLFEAPLLNIPIFMSMWDLSEFDAKLNTIFSINDNNFGVFIKDTNDLISKIVNIKDFDYTIQDKFKSKYLIKCDGNSSKRLIKYLEEEIENEK